MKKILFGSIGATVLFAAPTINVDTFCNKYYDKPIYDTPTGELKFGYYEEPLPVATSGPVMLAKVLRYEPTARCLDKQGREYEFSVPKKELETQKPTRTVRKSVAEIAIDAI